MRITKVTTKTGDQGDTALGDGSRVSKDNARIQCLGSIDELHALQLTKMLWLCDVLLGVKANQDQKRGTTVK